MRVKRYVVDSMPDALQKIRTDLGKDAVILNTKEVRSGGFLGLFTKKKIEVIAATDTASPSGNSSIPKMPSPASPKPSAPNPNAVQTSSLQQTLAAYGANVEEKAPLVFPEVPDVLPPTSSPSKQYRTQPDPAVKVREDVLLDEIKQMKEMMHRLSKQKASQTMDPILLDLEQRLNDQEIDPLLSKELLFKVSEEAETEGNPLTRDFAVEVLKNHLSDILRSSRKKSIATDTQIAHFVGPTGVGKTTTIAKLAAEQVLKYHRKVGFITSDTYRIAAVDQLKTYATILNVPLEVVFSPLDLTKAFEQLKDRDLIFMDTAGRNFRNEMYVSELNALLQSSGKSETFLVLSLSTKYKDMKVIADNFSKFKLDKVLFTKMDETNSYGSIINLIHDFGLQTSYLATGQNVPDDIVELNEQKIIELILGDDNHG